MEVRAKVKYTDGLQFVGESETGHAIVLDADREVGGKNTGMRPMELLLIAIGGCTGMDVASVLNKKRQHVTDIEVNVRGRKAEEHPQKYTSIGLEYIIKGRDLSEEAVKRAITLSLDKYCSVKATLEGTAEISYVYKIIED